MKQGSDGRGNQRPLKAEAILSAELFGSGFFNILTYILFSFLIISVLLFFPFWLNICAVVNNLITINVIEKLHKPKWYYIDHYWHNKEFMRLMASRASPCLSEKKVKEMGCKTQILIIPWELSEIVRGTTGQWELIVWKSHTSRWHMILWWPYCWRSRQTRDKGWDRFKEFQ